MTVLNQTSLVIEVERTAPMFRRDAMLVVAVALLACGAVIIASTSASLDRSLFDTGWLGTYFGRQIIFAGTGLVLMLATSRFAPFMLRSQSARVWVPRILFAFSVASLIATMIPGVASVQHGSGRWVRFATSGLTFGFQPSEIAKPALVLLLASILGESGADTRSLRKCFLPAAAVLGGCVLLVAKADFGTAVLLACVGGGLMIVAGCKWRYLMPIIAIGGAVMSALLYFVPYRMERLTAFRDVWADPGGAGYQPIQSLTAIASGGWFGTGLGTGVQKYGYLPECHTDFVFAILCEEMGAIGGFMIIALFGVAVWLGLRTMLAAPTRFERLTAFGLTALLGLQALMNMAVVTVVAPTTGISLPFVSAGGSGTLTFSLVVGMLAAIAARGAGSVRRQGAATTLRGS